MSDKKKSLPTRIAIWWLQNYEECVHFWIHFNWVLAIAIFIIGALEKINLVTTCLFILGLAISLNLALFCAICAMKEYLLSLEEGTAGYEEVHDLLISVILRLERRYEEKHGQHIK